MTGIPTPSGAPPAIRRLSERVVYSNEFAAVYDDPVVFADGSAGNYLRVVESDGNPGVAMLAVCDNQIALVLTYRYALASWEWAVPRGFAIPGDTGKNADRSARAELAEELGEEPDDLIPIGTVAPNSGLLSSRVQLFLARYATTISKPKDRKEVGEVMWISTKALHDKIASGEITDAFTLSAVTCAQARGLIEIF